MNGNGCGPKWLHKRIKNILFNWWFEDLCNEHDRAYEKGGTVREKLKADREFFNGMLNALSHLSWYVKPFASFQAVVFYLIVLLFGWTRFNYIKKYKR